MREALSKAYLEPDEVERMETQATNMRDRLLVRLLFRTGCRISEALAMRPEDVDLSGGTVQIQHLKIRLDVRCSECGTRLGRTHRFCPGCGGKVDAPQVREQERRRMRVIPVDPDTLEMFQEYIRRGGPVEKGGRQLLFGINRHHAWHVVRKCAQQAGLPRLINSTTGKAHWVSPHRLRDAFAVLAMKQDDSGDGLRLLQEMLGHVSFDTTAKYRKVAGTELKEWYKRMWGGKESNG